MNSIQYLAGLLAAEAARLRGEVPAEVRASGVNHPLSELARSFQRMSEKCEQTAASGLVEEV